MWRHPNGYSVNYWKCCTTRLIVLFVSVPVYTKDGIIGKHCLLHTCFPNQKRVLPRFRLRGGTLFWIKGVLCGKCMVYHKKLDKCISFHFCWPRLLKLTSVMWNFTQNFGSVDCKICFFKRCWKFDELWNLTFITSLVLVRWAQYMHIKHNAHSVSRYREI